MSLANLIVQPGRAVLQADAAGCSPDGRVVYLRPKLIPFEGARAALTVRGVGMQDEFAVALHAYGLGPRSSARRLFKALPQALRDATSMYEAANPNTRSGVCLSIIGWDGNRRRPFGLLLTNCPLWFDGKPGPYEWQPVDQCFGSIEATEKLLGPAPVLSDPARFNIERDALTLAEAQRAHPWGAWPIPDDRVAVAHRIGGWIDQAEVTARGVTVTRLVTWPDKLGEMIRPENAHNRRHQQ